MKEHSKEVVEKVLECVRDLADEFGPSGIENHIKLIMASVDQLLDKSAKCQLKHSNSQAHDDDDDDDDDEYDSEEDMDHDEIILGNSTDVLISVSKALGNDFLPHFTTIAPRLVKYLSDDYGERDRTMVIGCLSEIMASCPAAIDQYFDHFYKVLIQHSNGTDGELNRNISYGIGILCKNAPQRFEPILQEALAAVQRMHTASDAQDAKDNCIASIIRILDTFS